MDTSKIIKGVVNSGRYTVTAPIVKEDYGLYLQIEGVELPQTYEVDFSNSEHSGTSVTMIGNSDGVLIPHQFIDTGKDIFAFLYHVGADYGRTVYKFRIPNKVRPDRTNEQPTPEEQSVIDQAISALNDAVAQTAQDVIDADASAQSASTDADRAEEARTDAQNYADMAEQARDDAQTYANNASASATASAQSASQAEQIKSDVEDLVDDAQGYAQASAQSATASSNSASQAQGYAQSASASASSAQGYASNAQSYSQTASAKAQDASQSATTASTKASEASTSASQALTYKNDAESAKTASQTAQGLAESARDSAISAKNDAESARDEAQNLVDGISGKVEQIDSNTERIESLEDDRYKPYATDSASGAIASFSDGADDIPLKNLTVTLEPIQDTSQGEPSPENICPITGHTRLNLYACGGNLICKTLPEDAFVCGSLTTGDTTIPSGSLYRAYCVYVGKNTAIRYKKEGTSSFTVGLAFADEYITQRAGSVIYDALNMANRNNNTLNSGEHQYLVIVVAKSSVDSQSFNTRQVQTFFKTNNGDPIRYSPTCNIDKYLYDWEEETGIVYGCVLNVLTGVLSINKVIVDVGTLNIGATAPANGLFAFALPNGLTASGNGTVYDALCDTYKFATTGDNETHGDEDGVMWMYKSSANARIRDSRLIGYSASEAKAALSGVHVVYPLATPIEIQLEPHELASILGGNQIWTDNGIIDVEYRADTKLYIERLTAPDSADMIADANITSGQYFMVGNTLYKATANIANGGQIIVGTNCTRVSLAQALNEINT